MEVGLNNHLKRISSELFIKLSGDERRRINSSVSSIVDKLAEYFNDEIDEPILFGSYSRDTILPSRFDPNSDMIICQIGPQKVDVLKSHAEWVKQYLGRGEIVKAKKALERILPGF
jgi:tRNA nucleotidyltransferase (CCA-adding enzyme)